MNVLMDYINKEEKRKSDWVEGLRDRSEKIKFKNVIRKVDVTNKTLKEQSAITKILKKSLEKDNDNIKETEITEKEVYKTNVEMKQEEYEKMIIHKIQNNLEFVLSNFAIPLENNLFVSGQKININNTTKEEPKQTENITGEKEKKKKKEQEKSVLLMNKEKIKEPLQVSCSFLHFRMKEQNRINKVVLLKNRSSHIVIFRVTCKKKIKINKDILLLQDGFYTEQVKKCFVLITPNVGTIQPKEEVQIYISVFMYQRFNSIGCLTIKYMCNHKTFKKHIISRIDHFYDLSKEEEKEENKIETMHSLDEQKGNMEIKKEKQFKLCRLVNFINGNYGVNIKEDTLQSFLEMMRKWNINFYNKLITYIREYENETNNNYNFHVCTNTDVSSTPNEKIDTVGKKNVVSLKRNKTYYCENEKILIKKKEHIYHIMMHLNKKLNRYVEQFTFHSKVPFLESYLLHKERSLFCDNLNINTLIRNICNEYIKGKEQKDSDTFGNTINEFFDLCSIMNHEQDLYRNLFHTRLKEHITEFLKYQKKIKEPLKSNRTMKEEHDGTYKKSKTNKIIESNESVSEMNKNFHDRLLKQLECVYERNYISNFLNFIYLQNLINTSYTYYYFVYVQMILFLQQLFESTKEEYSYTKEDTVFIYLNNQLLIDIAMITYSFFKNKEGTNLKDNLEESLLLSLCSSILIYAQQTNVKEIFVFFDSSKICNILEKERKEDYDFLVFIHQVFTFIILPFLKRKIKNHGCGLFFEIEYIKDPSQLVEYCEKRFFINNNNNKLESGECETQNKEPHNKEIIETEIHEVIEEIEETQHEEKKEINNVEKNKEIQQFFEEWNRLYNGYTEEERENYKNQKVMQNNDQETRRSITFVGNQSQFASTMYTHYIKKIEERIELNLEILREANQENEQKETQEEDIKQNENEKEKEFSLKASLDEKKKKKGKKKKGKEKEYKEEPHTTTEEEEEGKSKKKKKKEKDTNLSQSTHSKEDEEEEEHEEKCDIQKDDNTIDDSNYEFYFIKLFEILQCTIYVIEEEQEIQRMNHVHFTKNIQIKKGYYLSRTNDFVLYLFNFISNNTLQKLFKNKLSSGFSYLYNEYVCYNMEFICYFMKYMIHYFQFKDDMNQRKYTIPLHSNSNVVHMMIEEKEKPDEQESLKKRNTFELNNEHRRISLLFSNNQSFYEEMNELKKHTHVMTDEFRTRRYVCIVSPHVKSTILNETHKTHLIKWTKMMTLVLFLKVTDIYVYGSMFLFFLFFMYDKGEIPCRVCKNAKGTFAKCATNERFNKNEWKYKKEEKEETWLQMKFMETERFDQEMLLLIKICLFNILNLCETHHIRIHFPIDIFLSISNSVSQSLFPEEEMYCVFPYKNYAQMLKKAKTQFMRNYEQKGKDLLFSKQDELFQFLEKQKERKCKEKEEEEEDAFITTTVFSHNANSDHMNVKETKQRDDEEEKEKEKEKEQENNIEHRQEIKINNQQHVIKVELKNIGIRTMKTLLREIKKEDKILWIGSSFEKNVKKNNTNSLKLLEHFINISKSMYVTNLIILNKTIYYLYYCKIIQHKKVLFVCKRDDLLIQIFDRLFLKKDLESIPISYKKMQ